MVGGRRTSGEGGGLVFLGGSRELMASVRWEGRGWRGCLHGSGGRRREFGGGRGEGRGGGLLEQAREDGV